MLIGDLTGSKDLNNREKNNDSVDIITKLTEKMNVFGGKKIQQ